MSDLIFLLIGLFIGLIIAIIWSQVARYKIKLQSLDPLNKLENEKSVLEEKIRHIEKENQQLNERVNAERVKVSNLEIQQSAKDVEYKNIQDKLENQKKEIIELNKKFTLEFENIASRILKQNTQDFSDTNQKRIDQILNPFKEKLEKFEKTVSETYEKGLQDQTDLKAELKNLHELNKRISEEASNLTNALKSDTKKQGNWGELILEKVLERSGLIQGNEYVIQYTDRNEEGELIRPDVIVNLPDNKHVIIDSKVSLTAYEAFVNEDDQNIKQKNLKKHVESVKDHVRILSEKNYHHAKTLDSPDFVLMFLPLESAFSVAIQHDPGLFNYAWDRKIVIVSPTTLLATLKTIESIWKHEKQTQNAIEIARQSGNLYDKFVNFLIDLENIGTQLDKVQKSYDGAHKKLSSGSGNLVGRIEKLKKLGARANKQIPSHLIDETSDNEE